MGQSKAMDRARRWVDAAMIVGALMLPAWPLVAGGAAHPAVVAAVVLGLGAGVVRAGERWPLLRYVPAAAAVLTRPGCSTGTAGCRPARPGFCSWSRRSSWSASSSARAPRRA